MKKALVFGGLTLLALSLPIWRGAGHSRHDGVSFWTMFHDSTNLTPESPFGHPHLPYDEAVTRAQEAWQEHIKGGA